MARETIRLNISVDMDVNEKLENTAKQFGISKAGVVRLMIYEYYKQEKALDAMSQMELVKTLLDTLPNK